MTGLYPFNPQDPDYSKLQPGEQYQQAEDSPGDIQEVEVDVTSAEPQSGPSSAPDNILDNCSISEPTPGPRSGGPLLYQRGWAQWCGLSLRGKAEDC